jgi:hypothetical protein
METPVPKFKIRKRPEYQEPDDRLFTLSDNILLYDKRVTLRELIASAQIFLNDQRSRARVLGQDIYRFEYSDDELVDRLGVKQSPGCDDFDVTVTVEVDYSEAYLAEHRAKYEAKLAEYEQWRTVNAKQIEAELQRREEEAEAKRLDEAARLDEEAQKLRARLEKIELKRAKL